jgi:hypothetical protein
MAHVSIIGTIGQADSDALVVPADGSAAPDELARTGGFADDVRPAGTISSRADVATGTPARYAKQLVAHLGRKLAFTGDAISSPATAVIGAATGAIVVGDGVLTLLAVGEDEESVAQVEQVLGGHLERFAQRDGLTARWLRARPTGDDGSAPSPTVSTATTTEESA